MPRAPLRCKDGRCSTAKTNVSFPRLDSSSKLGAAVGVNCEVRLQEWSLFTPTALFVVLFTSPVSSILLPRLNESFATFLFFPLFFLLPKSLTGTMNSSPPVNGSGGAYPTIISLFQVLTVLASPDGRKNLLKLINARSLAAVILSGLAWKITKHFHFKKLLRQRVEGHATFRHRNEAFAWATYFLKTHPRFRSSARDIEVFAPEKISRRKAIRSSTKEDGSKSDQDNKEIDTYFVPGPTFTMYFMFQGTLFRAQTRERETASGSTDERVELTFWSFSKAPLERLVIHMKALYMANHEDESKVPVLRFDDHGNWRKSRSNDLRTFETLHLDGSLKEDIQRDAQWFFSEQGLKQYTKRSVPYRRGYCLWGPPGNGKSTLAQVLASELGEPLYVIDLNQRKLDDYKFSCAMSALPPRCIVLIEDVDAIFVDRKKENEEKSSAKSSVSFSCLINSLDGVDAATGRLLIITTNHLEKLDGALLRNGRVDRRFEIKNATKEVARELFVRWFKPDDATTAKESIQELAEAFSQSIPNGLYSVSALQGLLLQSDDDPQRAVKGVPAWIQMQEEEMRMKDGRQQDKPEAQEDNKKIKCKNAELSRVWRCLVLLLVIVLAVVLVSRNQ